MLRVLYLCPFSGRGGGPRVIARHVQGLAARGHRAEWWGLEPDPSWWAGHVPYRRFSTTDALGAALQAEPSPKVVVATWWETAWWVMPNIRAGDVGAYLVQDIDQRTYGGDESGTSYSRGLHHVTESRWVTDELFRQYGQTAVNVGIGIDDTFHPLGIPRERYRVMTTYRPGTGDLKGWGLALEAVRLASRRIPQVSLVTYGGQGRPRGQMPVPHIHVDSPTDGKLCELYAQAGVYLMTSRHEGFGLPAAEAMATGCPVVTTDANGNREFCHDEQTCLMRRDAQSLADAIVEVMRNPDRAAAIGEAGRLYVARYRWDAVVDRLESLYRMHIAGG